MLKFKSKIFIGAIKLWYINSIMKSLSQFAANAQVFRDATNLPVFFQNNLLHPGRVVKVFADDPQGHIRIFSYQYLKLCFEIEDINYNFYIRKIQYIINSEFRFIFPPDEDPAVFNDAQAKSLIIEFFGLLGEGRFNVQTALDKYPIMDYILTHLYRSILIQMKKTAAWDSYMSRDQILGFLCPYFGIALQIHEKCVQYVQTDIFVYEQSPQQIYMAYMEDERSETQSTPRSSGSKLRGSASLGARNFEQVSLKTNEVVPLSIVSPGFDKNGYIVSQFNDFTGSNANSKVDANSHSQIIRSPDLLHVHNAKISPFNSNEPQNQQSKLTSVVSPPPFSPKLHKDDLFYNPKKDNGSYQKTDLQLGKGQSSKVVTKVVNNTNGVIIEKKPFGLNVSEEFTNSLTMKSMIEPYRSNVSKLRVRARNFRNSLVNFIK